MKQNSFEAKTALAKELFVEFFNEEFELFASNEKHFRTRAEFSIFHDENGAHYAMFDAQTKKKFIIYEADFADEKICALMPKLLKQINSNENLRQKLFGVEFLASKNELSATLLYHKDVNLINDDLQILSNKLNLNLIARSKGKKLIFGKENLSQVLEIETKNSKIKQNIFYEFNNDCFIQPNTRINEKMISWAIEVALSGQRRDLLELYCGYGNFTLALSRVFNKVLATELSKKNIEFALKNCALNNVSNIDFARLSSLELCEALKFKREFFRLKNVDLKNFNFSHIFLDPPRAGLEEEVINLALSFENIIYISCNPLTLKRDLIRLCKSHEVKKFALFDQFVKTPHLECAVLLTKIK